MRIYAEAPLILEHDGSIGHANVEQANETDTGLGCERDKLKPNISSIFPAAAGSMDLNIKIKCLSLAQKNGHFLILQGWPYCCRKRNA